MRHALLLALLLLVSGCGGDDETAVVVSAAASLKPALTDFASDYEARFSFAGSDELAAQIRQGVKPDVFAAANTTLPAQLHAEGLVEKPTVFATNRLVIASDGTTDIDTVDDLAADGVTLAIGAESVPVGSYTRQVLDRLPAPQRVAILANVRSNEPDVAGVVGKIAQGAVDAGFVYASDVQASGGRLKSVELPRALQPSVSYGVAVVKDAPHPEAAKDFVDGLLSEAGRDALRNAGFEAK